MSQPVLTLDYAKAQSLGGTEAQRAFRLLLMVAILSGLCVGVCFLAMAGGVVGAALHVIVFAATIFIAIKGGRAMMGVMSGNQHQINPAQLVLDLLAVAGLMIIGIAPVVYQFFEGRSQNRIEIFGAGAMTLAYGLLAGTTYRHLLFHRTIANYCRQNNQYRMAKAVITLGWVKMIYEGIWLSLCTLALLSVSVRNIGDHGLGWFEDVAVFCAIGAFFGAIGFSVVWLWMIVVHANLMRLASVR